MICAVREGHGVRASGRALCAALLACAAWLPGTAARAQPAGAPPALDARSPPQAQPTPEQKQAASDHFTRGRAFANFGAHDDAIREYEAAYALVPVAELLFNIAQAYRAKGDRARALDYYHRYLVAEPQGSGADFARAHVAALEAEARADQAERERRALQADQAARLALQREASRRVEAETMARRAAEEAAQRKVAEEAARTRAREARWLRYGGAASAAAGALALGLGVRYGLQARDKSRDATGAMVLWTDQLEAEYADAESAERKMLVLSAIGATAIVAGGVLAVLGWRRGGRRERPARPTTLAPALTPSSAGLALALSY